MDIYHILLTHPSVDRHLSVLHLRTNMNNAAVNIVYTCLCGHMFLFLLDFCYEPTLVLVHETYIVSLGLKYNRMNLGKHNDSSF